MLLQWYKYVRILSIDVVLGACAMSCFVAYVLSVKLPLASLLILGLSVWLIYTCDHLIDAKRNGYKAATERHAFHQQYFIPVLLLWICILVFTAWITFHNLSRETLKEGLLVLVASVIYLFLVWLFGTVRSVIVQKEFAVALVYTAGIAIAPLSAYHGKITGIIVVLLFQVFLIAFVNLILFALLDYETDKKDRHTSLVQVTGKELTRKIIGWLMSGYLLITLLGCIWFRYERVFLEAEFILLLMMGILCWIFRTRENPVDIFFYKGIADAIFFLPLLILFV